MINILEVDAGNTRTKWRVVNDNSLDVDRVSVNYAEVSKEFESTFESLFVDDLTIGHVRVSSVRGEDFDKQLLKFFKQKFALKAWFAKTAKNCAGVTNSYRNVSLMGVDRWLAMLSAFNLSDQEKGCCIVDCGSALTIDIVDAGGYHQGGYILPGLTLALQSLKDRSKALDIGQSSQWSSLNLGKSTNEAMENGILAMQVSLLEKIHQSNSELSWFICGGDAEFISPFIGWECSQVESLVLDGLVLAN